MQPPFTRGHGDSSYTVPLDALDVESISEAVTTVIAAYTDTRLTDLEPLAGSIDPDALDRLFGPPLAGRKSTVREVRFEYQGCLLTVRATGQIGVRPARTAGDSSADEPH